MKIILTGSTGNINQYLIGLLKAQGHDFTVISSTSERTHEIEKMGAKAAIGSLEDSDFVTQSFKGADLVYCMIPPNNYFDQNLDLLSYYIEVATNFKSAIEANSIKQVIYLSSIGGHLKEGNGILKGHYEGEQLMRSLPKDINITILRPVEFYYNLLGQIPTIKNDGIMASVCGGGVVNVWVSPQDIAATIAEEVADGISIRKVRYIACEEITYNNLAKKLGKAIGKPDLAWVQITSDQLISGLKTAGMNPQIAEGLVEMYEAIDSGALYEDYNKNKPETFGNVKVEDFGIAFAKAYHA